MNAASPAGTAVGSLTPYGQSAFLELGRCLQGGKPDDITVVVSYVLDRQPSGRTPTLTTPSEVTEGSSPRTPDRTLQEGGRWSERDFLSVSTAGDEPSRKKNHFFSNDLGNAVTATHESRSSAVGPPSSFLRPQGQEHSAEKRGHVDTCGAPNAPLCMRSGSGSLLRSVPVQYSPSPGFRIKIKDRPVPVTEHRERSTTPEISPIPVFRSVATASPSSGSRPTWGYASLASALQCSRRSFPGGKPRSRIASATPACVAAVHSLPQE